MKKSILCAIVFMFAITSIAFARVEKEYYPNKQLRSIERYDNKDKLNGVYKYYWPNGQLKEVGRYKDGVRVGTPKKYTIDGELR